jgi:hypothetical protein
MRLARHAACQNKRLRYKLRLDFRTIDLPLVPRTQLLLAPYLPNNSLERARRIVRVAAPTLTAHACLPDKSLHLGSEPLISRKEWKVTEKVLYTNYIELIKAKGMTIACDPAQRIKPASHHSHHIFCNSCRATCACIFESWYQRLVK